jgi:glutathione synthase/RimK-type ligase-like ATP-grasp enzyme
MLRLCWIFPDRDTASQRGANEELFWANYAAAAESQGMRMTWHAPEEVIISAVSPGRPSVLLNGEPVGPEDTIFVTELYSFPHQATDIFNQVTLFTALEQAGFYLPIPPGLSYIANDKLATMLYLRDSPITPVPTVRIPTGRDSAHLDLSAALAGIKFPMIVKPAGWGSGQGVCVTRNESDLKALIGLASGSDCTLVCQPYLGPGTIDYRVYFVAGEPYRVMLRRPARDSVVANLVQGGSAEIVNIPRTLSESAGYFTSKLPIPYFAIDFLFDGTDYWLSEIEPDAAHGYLPREITQPLLEARFSAYRNGHAQWCTSLRESSITGLRSAGSAA